MTRFIDKLSDVGLRLVGYSDEISNIRHKGWFTDDDIQDETYRGAVVQLPGRKGYAVLLPAYQESCNDGFIVDFGDATLVRALDDGLTGEDETRTVAREGDRMAERAAEEARDYNRAWRLGADHASLREEIAADHAHLRAVLAEFRQARKVGALGFETLCATVRASVVFGFANLARARSKRDAILEDNYFRGPLVQAFNEGAGETILT